ncbi:hypothetical protein M885DRAFT_158988 [Pelagophyceae sp. CCMP2097]|nr:hypothetical protein M885DRAFT_158988 [Pelagophyceae sp. CCMP2097]
MKTRRAPATFAPGAPPDARKSHKKKLPPETAAPVAPAADAPRAPAPEARKSHKKKLVPPEPSGAPAPEPPKKSHKKVVPAPAAPGAPPEAPKSHKKRAPQAVLETAAPGAPAAEPPKKSHKKKVVPATGAPRAPAPEATRSSQRRAPEAAPEPPAAPEPLKSHKKKAAPGALEAAKNHKKAKTAAPAAKAAPAVKLDFDTGSFRDMLESQLGAPAALDVTKIDAALVREGLEHPLVVRAKDAAALGLKMPPLSLTPRQVAAMTCPETLVPVLDVRTQSSAARVSLEEWASYWERTPRWRVLNVISLEISGSALGDLVQGPQFVAEVDWTATAWPKCAPPHVFQHVGCGCGGTEATPSNRTSKRLVGLDEAENVKESDFDALLLRKCAFEQENPKKPDSQSHARYELYKAAVVVGDVLRLGGTRADVMNDLGKGFITFENDDGEDDHGEDEEDVDAMDENAGATDADEASDAPDEDADDAPEDDAAAADEEAPSDGRRATRNRGVVPAVKVPASASPLSAPRTKRRKPAVVEEEQLLARPRVEKYCLMSTGGCFTDFHVDFGGTSVWYHVLSGAKVMYVAGPTKENLAAFKRWSSRASQSSVTFASVAPPGAVSKLELHAGDTLIIPAGWIHAVATPVDSIVFGGNFLCASQARNQLKIVHLEDALRVPMPQRFPAHSRLHWCVCRKDGRRVRRPIR